ncbi:hypothetical protein [Aeromicrobium sp. NPDC092404]|uniref:hypothetical protein n=1 Tax=Aeromicrobium sp. NPDC092404 TaxID=3154976 RepID=UPI0034349400
MPDLASTTLLYLAPRGGTSGVGDHADDFVAAVTPHLGDIVELRHGPPREDGIGDVLRTRWALRSALAERRDRTVVVHAELSGGSLAGLWAAAGAQASVRTATLHDPPRPVWYPYLTKGLARSRYLVHGAHLPFDRLTARVERRLMRDVEAFALSAEGVEAMAAAGVGASQTVSHLLIPARPVLPPADERPRAVGLFGHVYRGKGFDQLMAIRRALDPGVALRVAGRGTADLPLMPGVEILGEVRGAAEDEFFASVRALLLPYERRYVYGGEVFPASSVLMRALAYRTPSLSTGVGPLSSAARAGATIVVDGDGTTMAAAAADLVDDPARLQAATDDLDAFAATQTIESAIAPYLQAWAR